MKKEKTDKPRIISLLEFLQIDKTNIINDTDNTTSKSKYISDSENNTNIDKKKSFVDTKIKYTNDYWGLKSIHNDVLEFIVNSDSDDITDVKMYIIPNPEFKYDDDDNIYYSVFTVAYNKIEKKTLSNFFIESEKNIKDNFNIDIQEILMDTLLNEAVVIDEDQRITISELIGANYRILKHACGDANMLQEIIYQLLDNITYGEEFDLGEIEDDDNDD